MQRTAILNGSNLNQDKDYSLAVYAILTPGVVEGLQVTTNSVGVGKAFIQVTRTSVTPNDVFYIVFENTSAVTIDTSGTKKVFIKIPKNNVNDPGYNLTNEIATIQTDTAYPSEDYIPLASITGGVITDARSFVKLKGKYVDGALITKEADPVPSASTLNLSVLNGNYVHVTGTTTITSFGNVADGAFEICFDSAGLTITNGSIRLPTGANIITQAGDTMIVRGDTTAGDWRVISYQRKDGSPLASVSVATTISTFTAGENITIGDAVYISSADGKCYKCIANDVSKINFIGFAKSTVLINTPLSIDTNGQTTVLSGLTIRASYFLTDTAGIISTTPGTNVVYVGQALSTTSILISDNLRLSDVIASDNLKFSLDTERIITSTTIPYAYQRLKSFILKDNIRNGKIRVKFSIRTNNAAAGKGTYGQVYINGVATGTIRGTLSTSPVEFSEDFNISSGDEVQLYIAKENSSYGGFCSNFRIYYDRVELSTTTAHQTIYDGNV